MMRQPSSQNSIIGKTYLHDSQKIGRARLRKGKEPKMLINLSQMMGGIRVWPCLQCLLLK